MKRIPTHLPGNWWRTASLTACVLALPPLAAAASAQVFASAQQANPSSSVSLKDLLREWEKQYGASISYASDLVRDKLVAPAPTAGSLEQKLAAVLPQAGLRFEKTSPGYYVVLRAAPGPAAPRAERAAGPRASVQEDITVSGRVTQANGDPLPGVTVIVKGTTRGTSTDADGRFTLAVPVNSTLQLSSVGFASKEIVITATTTNLAVQLTDDAKGLDEVVVVGYGTQKKSDVTGALSSVSEAQIQQVTTQNVTQALQGRAAGVDVAGGNFRPGEVPAIRIRGNRSIRASNEPLYVVDGIPLAQGTGLNDFNPQDIESVEVLKDASATAIYGSRGANGVILVTTKRGKEGKFSINYNTYFSVDKASRTYDLFSGGEFLELQREANRNTNAYPFLYADPARDYALFGSVDPYAWEGIADGYEWIDRANRVVATRATTPEEQARYGVSQIPIYDASKVRTTDWQKLALRTALTQNHQLSASGGTEKLRASMSVGYLNQEGIQPGQDFARYNARATLDFKVNSAITLGASTNASLTVQNYGPDVYGRALGQIPYATPYTPEGAFIVSPAFVSTIYNPLREVDNNFNERRVTRFFGSFYAEAKLPLKGLRYRLNVGPDFRNSRTGVFQSALAIARDAGGPSSTSYASYDQGQNFTYVVENLLFYDRQFGQNHSLSLTALQSAQADRGEGSSVSATNLPYDSQRWYNLGSTYQAAANGFGTSFSKRTLMSWMGRINYAFKDRYLLTLTGRADGASVLAPGNQWSFFPSVAVAWKMQEENFLRNVTVLSELKLRGGYGSVGQASVDPYTTGGTLQQSRYAWNETPAYGYSPTPGTLPGTLGGIPNPNLQWERTSTLNLGLDFGFFKNRVSGSVEVYRANTTDLLLSRALPTVSGIATILQNIGATRNSGVEVSLTTVNISRTNGLRWSTDFIYTRNKEEFVRLASGAQDDVGNRWFIGQPLGVYYNYQQDGIWQLGQEDAAKRYGLVPGDRRVVDQNNDGIINANDFVILGSNRPKWSGSINNTFSFKGFDLSFLVYARIGQKTATGINTSTGGVFPGQKVDYWTPTNPTNEFPRPVYKVEAKNSGGVNIVDGSFARVRNISLTYTVPQAVSSKLRMTNLSVYVNAVNPLLFTSFKGLDPEATDIGTTSTETVQARNLNTKSWVFGLRVGF